jgi:hypothetical protein
VIPNGQSRADIVSTLKDEAIELAIRNGASRGSVEVLEVDTMALQYVGNDAFRAVVKAVRNDGSSLPVSANTYRSERLNGGGNKPRMYRRHSQDRLPVKLPKRIMMPLPMSLIKCHRQMISAR